MRTCDFRVAFRRVAVVLHVLTVMPHEPRTLKHEEIPGCYCVPMCSLHHSVVLLNIYDTPTSDAI